MSIERQITEVILKDSFSGPLRKIAAEQDAYARRTSQINAVGNAFLFATGGAVAFMKQSVQVAGTVSAITKTMAVLEGAQKAAFDTKYVDQYARKSSQTYMDLMKSAELLVKGNVNVQQYLPDVATIAAFSRRSPEEISNYYRLIASNSMGLPLGARGLPRLGIPIAEIFKAEGLPYRPGMKLQGSITPAQVFEGIDKYLHQRNIAGLDQRVATNTLYGAAGMMHDAATRFENAVGQIALPDVIRAMNSLAGMVNKLADFTKGHPRIARFGIEGIGVGVLAGGIWKGVAAWRQYHQILKGVAAIGKVERDGEKEKSGIAQDEASAVEGAAAKYGGLRGILIKLGTAYGGEAIAARGATAAMMTGLGVVGLYAIAAVGLAADIYAVVGAFRELGKASTAVEQAHAAQQAAVKSGYTIINPNGGKPTGLASKSVARQYWEIFANTLTFGHAYKSDMENTGFTATAVPGFNRQRFAMPAHGVRAKQLADEAAQRAQAAKAAAEARITAANSYELPYELQSRLKAEKDEVEILKLKKASQKEYNRAKAQEIADLMKARNLLLEQARIATDPKHKAKMIEQAADLYKEAVQTKFGDHKKGGLFDPTIAKIISSAGLSEDDVLKRTGIGRRFFRSIKGNQLPADPIHSMVKQLSKRPVVFQFKIGDKVLQELKTEFSDETLKDLLHLLETSGNRPALGGA